ncbi:CRISPR-associated protein Cas1 [Saccharolobus shibatae]|uniref:CRISPR-associated protein Cas1 n=1 Tax=Saccharolobus shibatae TaxID=2286 RepID=A0A8F5GZG7_9CREN|nr:CRISPR-associated protein Cas1 [Saccharolobus shibatae]
MHKYRAGRPSLVLDLMEDFRSPFVDRKLIGIARQKPEDVKDIKVIYTNMVFEEEIYTQARRFANAILHNEEYKPYMAK